jgi:hypothetical protein
MTFFPRFMTIGKSVQTTLGKRVDKHTNRLGTMILVTRMKLSVSEDTGTLAFVLIPDSEIRHLVPLD